MSHTYIDWDTARVQFEVFKTPVKTIAAQLGVTPKVVEYARDSQGWQEQSADNLPKEMVDLLEQRAELTRNVSNATLTTRYVRLETAIVNKAIDLLEAITVDSPAAAKQVEAMANVLSSLKEQNGTSKRGAAQGGNGLTVRVLNHVDRTGDSHTGVEVQVASASVN